MKSGWVAAVVLAGLLAALAEPAASRPRRRGKRVELAAPASSPAPSVSPITAPIPGDAGPPLRSAFDRPMPPGSPGRRDVFGLQGLLADRIDPVRAVVALFAGGVLRRASSEIERMPDRSIRVGGVAIGGDCALTVSDVEVLQGQGEPVVGISRLRLLSGASPSLLLNGLTAPLAVLGRTARLDAAEATLRLSDRQLELKAATVVWPGSTLAVRGRVDNALSDAVLADVRLFGTLDLGQLDGRCRGRARVMAAVSGPVHDLEVEGTLRAEELRLERDGPDVHLRDVKAPFALRRGQLELRSVTARVMDGQLTLSGERSLPGASDTRVSALRLENGSLRELSSLLGGGPGPAGARVWLDFSGRLSGSLARTAGRGRATVSGLSIDLSRSPRIDELRRTVEGASTAAGLASSLARSGTLGSVASRALERLRYYQELLAELGRSHGLGRVTSPFEISSGVLRLPGIEGAGLRGSARVHLDGQTLEGSFERITLGRVTLRDVGVSGSRKAPSFSLDPKNARLDGRPAPPMPALDALIDGVRSRRGGQSRGGPIFDRILGRRSDGRGSDRIDPASAVLEILQGIRGRRGGATDDRSR